MSISTLGANLFHFTSRTDDSDSVEERDISNRDEPHQRSRVVLKSSGACVHCKSLKVKCEFSPGESICQRCQAGNYQCLARGRKKRKPAPTHEDLQEKARSQDIQIQALLLQFDRLRADHKINRWMERAQSLDKHQPFVATKTLDVERPRLNMKFNPAENAIASYFSPGGGPSELSVPDLVKYCTLHPKDIMDLFAIFFDKINSFFSILDPEMHTPGKLIWTSPFLFTVICAIASRYYPGRQNLYPLAMNFARDAAGRALIDGSTGVDICQAYLLMAVYPIPKKKWTEDRSWLLMGVAIRMAIELKLNEPPLATCDERDRLNRTRTWLNCYCADGSHAIQFGKMPMLRLDDYVARNSRHWYKTSPMNIPFDVHLCAYVHIIILVAEWRSKMTQNLNKKSGQKLDVVASVIETQERLSQEWSIWVEAYAEEYLSFPLPICRYRGNTTQMITSYLRLVILAVGFQHSVKSGLSRNSIVVTKSVHAAREVIQIMMERLYPTGNLRFAMEAHFLYVSFAAAFLVNLLRPKFLHLLNENEQGEIIRDVSYLIDVLGSKDVALDGRHTPAVYSRFLSSLLAKYNTKPPCSWTDSPPNDHDHNPQPAHSESHQPTNPHLYSWPDIVHTDFGSDDHGRMSSDGVYHHGEVDMDFSLSHFVRTIAQEQPPRVSDDQVIPEAWNAWEFQNDQSHWFPTQSLDFPDVWRS